MSPAPTCSLEVSNAIPAKTHTRSQPWSVLFFWPAGFCAACRFPLAAVAMGYSSLQCMDFSLWWLLLWSTGSRYVGFSSCSTIVYISGFITPVFCASLFREAWCFWGSPMVLHASTHSFYVLSSFPLYRYSPFIYLFPCWWTFESLLVFTYYKQRCQSIHVPISVWTYVFSSLG